jgi:hypothetical protein
MQDRLLQRRAVSSAHPQLYGALPAAQHTARKHRLFSLIARSLARRSKAGTPPALGAAARASGSTNSRTSSTKSCNTASAVCCPWPTAGPTRMVPSCMLALSFGSLCKLDSRALLNCVDVCSFILFKSAAHLNNKHTVFGRVVGGMDVLRTLELVPTGVVGTPDEDRPQQELKIVSMVVFVNPFDTLEEERAEEETKLAQKRLEENVRERFPAVVVLSCSELTFGARPFVSSPNSASGTAIRRRRRHRHQRHQRRRHRQRRRRTHPASAAISNWKTS